MDATGRAADASVFVLVAGVIGAVLFMPAVYFFGLWLAPPRPVPEATPAPALLREALWARADGGPATELRPINPINFVQHRVCRALAARQDDPKVRGERRAECLKQLPAIQGDRLPLGRAHARPRRAVRFP